VRNNPLAGPDHVGVLKTALEQQGGYLRPPSTGGDQISIRLSESLLAQLDVIAKRAEWTRAQVLTALIERGLFDLYHRLSDDVGELIMEQLTHILVPTMRTYISKYWATQNSSTRRWELYIEYKQKIDGVADVIDTKRMSRDYSSEQEALDAGLSEHEKSM